MESLHPPGRQVSPAILPPRSFAEALTTHPFETDCTANAVTSNIRLGHHKGEIAAFFPREIIQKYSTPFRYALVGKFSHGRPTMEIIQKFFTAQDLQDQFSVGLLDSKHILIRLHGEKDFHRIYSRMIWYISSKAMRVFKWTDQFHVDRESSLVPIWVMFPKLPIHFFTKEALFSLASLFGQPLRLDSATSNLKRPSVARLQVEIDVMKPMPSRLWIGTEDGQGFWQQIELDESLPSYCSYCWHIGHDEQLCYVKNPELKVVDKKQKGITENKASVEYRPKKAPTGIIINVNDSSGSGLIMNEKNCIPTIEVPAVIHPEIPVLPITDQDDHGTLASQQTNQPPISVDVQLTKKILEPIKEKIAVVQTESHPDSSNQELQMAGIPHDRQNVEKNCQISEVLEQNVKENKQNSEMQMASVDLNLESTFLQDGQLPMIEPITSISIDLKEDPSSISFGIVPVQQQQVLEMSSTLEITQENIKDKPAADNELASVQPSKANTVTHTYRRLTDEELIARMPDRLWQTPTRAVHSTDKKKTSQKENLLQEPQKILSFKLPEISRENEMSQIEEAMDDDDISIQVEQVDHDDFIPLISKKQKARNKKDYSLSMKTVHTRQDSKRPAP